MDEKKKLDKSSSVGASNRGYEIIGNQGLQEGTLPDLKEVFSPPHPTSLLSKYIEKKINEKN
jgi:hypothetical protein